MHDVIFEWDENKNQFNIQKHKVSFNEAVTAFSDDNAILIPDESHSEYEERFILLGLSKTPRLLVVCHCCKNENNIIRIISARKANKHESEQYGGIV